MTVRLPDVDIDGLLESGFTPGPWSHVNGCMAPDFVIRGNELDEDVQVVCGSVDCIESVANSKLIAAAPSLLHLCAAQRDQIASLEARVEELVVLNDDLSTEIMHTRPHLLDEAKIQLGWRCEGCGADYSLRELKARNPKSISCCPERNLLPQTLIRATLSKGQTT